MSHWAAHVMGKRYESGASGPESFDCIGLVRYYFKERYNILLPDYKVVEGFVPLLNFARATGWRRRLDDRPQDDDIVLMDGIEGRHVGVMVRSSEGLGMLHAQGNDVRGSVVWQPLNSLFGYRNFEYWGKECS